MPKRPNNKIVDDAIAALDTVRREWLRRPGVTAVDVGFKIKNNVLTDEIALRVHVARKIPVTELSKSEVFNESGKTPKRVGGFPVDVIEATYGLSSGPNVVLEDADEAALEVVDRRSVVNPLIGGVSCGNQRVTAGTLAAIVFDRTSGDPMILSNWHVLAGSPAASPGENILQPGRVDGGTQTVATLTRMILDSRMDAAVAALNGARPHATEVLGLGSVQGIDDATLGMLVVKSGRTTAITRGVVDGVSLSTSINYAHGSQSFSNQIHIVPRAPWPAVDYEVSMGGDSGSVWLNEANNRAIGLHFAGETDPSPSSENAICCPMRTVANALNFTFRPVLIVAPPDWPVRPRLWDLCRRYPRICELIHERPKWPPVLPPIDFGKPIDINPGLIKALGGFLGAQSAGGCGCGGSSGQSGSSELASEIAALLAEMAGSQYG